MNPVCVDVKDLLVAESTGGMTFGGTDDWSVFISSEPETPDRAVTIYETGGRTPSVATGTSISPVEYPDFQVRVRGRTYTETCNQLETIRGIISHKGGFTVGGAKYNDMYETGNPLDLPRDENGRYIRVLNFSAIRQATG